MTSRVGGMQTIASQLFKNFDADGLQMDITLDY